MSYERSGGYMTVANYEKSLAKEELEKQRYLRRQAGAKELTNEEKVTKYIRTFATKNDKELTPGKTYKIYAKNNDNKTLTNSFLTGAIRIFGYEYGTIEVKE